MALTRKTLKGMGLTEEQIESIIEFHTETIDGLKAERDSYKEQASSVVSLKKELEDANNRLNDLDKDGYKAKYESLKTDFDNYKQGIETEKITTAKKRAYRDALIKAGINEKHVDKVMRVSDFNSIELVDGAIKDAEKLNESIKSEWSDFIEESHEEGADVHNHPNGGGSADGDKAKVPTLF